MCMLFLSGWRKECSLTETVPWSFCCGAFYCYRHRKSAWIQQIIYFHLSLVTMKSSLSLKGRFLIQIRYLSMWLEYYSMCYRFKSLSILDLLDKLTRAHFLISNRYSISGNKIGYSNFFFLKVSASRLISSWFSCWSKSNLSDTAESHTPSPRAMQDNMLQNMLT